VTVAVDRAGSADNDDDPNRVEIILVKSPGPATRRRWRLTDGQETAPRFTSSYGLDGGGGAGEYGEIIITSPSATYTHTVGAGGNGGAAGTNAGGVGG
jgi:hypothetical protein